MEGKLNKRLLMIGLKYTPWVIAVIYLIQLIFSCFGLESLVLSLLASIGIVPSILLLLFSYMFGFCIWHRMPIYYVLTTNVINAFDFYVGIPIANKWMLIVYLLLAIVFMLIGAYKKNEYNIKKRNIKNSTA